MDMQPEGIMVFGALRQRAERQLQTRAAGSQADPDSLAPAEVRSLLKELQVHQIELEIQNQELVRAQAGLQASTERYFDLYDHAPVGYCTLSPDGRILEANLCAGRMLGIPLERLVQQPLTRFLLKQDQDVYYLHRKEFLISPGPHSCELRMVRTDGAAFWVQLTATDVPATGEASLRRVVLSDITGLKRAEEDKLALATQLHLAQKLETLGVFAAGVSKDYSVLLNAILTSASAGSRAAGGNGLLARYFGTIEASATRATELTHQLLAYAGKAQWTLEDVDLDGVAKAIGQILASCLPEPLTFTSDLADHLPLWRGDSTQAYQILMNLVMNALESFPAGLPGRITLRTREATLDNNPCGIGIWALPVEPGRYVVLEVEDSGIGMTPDHLYHAFEPFYTTKATGRGLGLASVHGILRSHGGGLWVQSSPGQGTSFRVYLPVQSPVSQAAAPLVP